MFSYKHNPNQNMEHCYGPRKWPSSLPDTEQSALNGPSLSNSSVQSSGKPEEDGEERLLFACI